jgi:hypothetical protein
MTAPSGASRFQAMAVFPAEMRDIDHCHRIGRLDLKQRACGHGGDALAGLQNGKGALKPPEVVDRLSFVRHQLPQIFQKGRFFGGSSTATGASVVGATAASAFAAATAVFSG